MSIYDILEDLASDNSRNFKLHTLHAHSANTTLMKVVFLALDPFTQFYIRKIPAYTPAKKNQADSLDSVLDSLTMLSTRQVTGNAAIEHLTKLLSSLTEKDANVLERVIQKDLKCGVSDSTANKVWSGIVHEYPCMLASAYDQKLVDKVKFPAYAQLKMDGMRFNAIVRNGKVEFRSRNGKEINVASELFVEPFIHMSNYFGQDMVFDGELLVVDDFGKPMDRKTGNGILNKAVKGTQSKQEGERVRATIWDAIPFEFFHQGAYHEPYSSRFAKLSNCVSDLKNRSAVGHLADVVESREVKDIREAQKIFEKYLAKGQEGIILKTREMIWENKRSKHQIKFKGELECDLKVVDWIEGTGKYVGRMGSLVLESSCGGVRVNVGTGFSDIDRDSITHDNSVGRIVAVKYNARISDKNSDVDSLFLPVFVEFRDDKSAADKSKDIK